MDISSKRASRLRGAVQQVALSTHRDSLMEAPQPGGAFYPAGARSGRRPLRPAITSWLVLRGLIWGAIAGLAGTLVMDLLLMAALSAVGLPAFTCFSIVGDTVAHSFALLGIQVAGGIPFGVATHYLVGPLVGAIFGVAVSRSWPTPVDTIQKSILFAVLYVQLLSQPLLALTPILLKMAAADTLKWYGGSFVMHLIWGVVLGVVVSCGLGLAAPADRR